MAAAGSEVNLDIWKQVNQFLQGTSRSSPQVSFESLSTSALFLLRTVPVARHAVLEHYANVFDDAVSTHLRSMESGNRDNVSAIRESQLTALQDVTGILLSFIHSNPEAWAPVVSTWSLTLLGQMSSKYGNKRGIHSVTPLNEILHLWMACPPAKMLVDMTTQCFAAMVGGAPDMCVDALLEASVRYSHFDWVVAHIGSCFPKTIITRVLNCGLKDFCNSGRSGTERDLAASRLKIPKMESVVGILGHLAAQHQQDIRKALMSMFQASLRPGQPVGQVTYLPFLLQLASMSSMLLTILTTDLINALTASVLNQLHQQFIQWKRASPAEYTSFLNLVVHLIGKCQVGSYNIINFVLNTAIPTGGSPGQELPCEEVRDTCSEIVHILLFELQRGVISRRKDGSQAEIPLLLGLSEQSELLTSTLLTCDDKRSPWLLKLATFTGLQTGEYKAASMLAHVIFYAQTPKQLSVFYQLNQGLEIGFPNIVKSTLNHVFNKLNSSSPSSSSSETHPATESSTSAAHSPSSSAPASSSATSWYQRALRNLEKILSVEDAKVKKKLASGSLIIDSMRQRHAALCEFSLSDDPNVCISVLRLMSVVGFPKDLSTAQLTKLCGAVALSFMSSLHWSSDKKEPRWARMTRLCLSCMEQLSYFPFTKSLLIHYLIDGAVSKTNFKLFGGKDLVAASSYTPPTNSVASTVSATTYGDYGSLLEENNQQRLSIALPRSHSSVYHGGVIKRMTKNLASKQEISVDAASRNRTTLIETLWHCCREPHQRSSGQSGMSAVKEEPMETDVPCSSTQPPSAPSAKSSLSSDWTISESAARTLGCVLVDVLTSDSLYNDVLWPDPEFRKVTTERDTFVWKRLEELSFLWDIIEEFSTSCVFIYYLSPILRSIMAAIMNWLETSRLASMADFPKLHQAAVRLLACLTKGQLLPSPLSNVSELFPFITPYEGYLLLLSIWHYIKENPPSEFEAEVKFRVCNSSHTQVASSIIHANIEKIAHLSQRILHI